MSLEKIFSNTARANEPLICKSCGSTYFYELQAGQYAAGGYNSASYRKLSTITIGLRKCVSCGFAFPLRSGQPSAASMENQFVDQLNTVNAKLAQIMQEEKNPPDVGMIQSLIAEQTITREEYYALEDKLKNIMEILKVLDQPNKSNLADVMIAVKAADVPFEPKVGSIPVIPEREKVTVEELKNRSKESNRTRKQLQMEGFDEKEVVNKQATEALKNGRK